MRVVPGSRRLVAVVLAAVAVAMLAAAARSDAFIYWASPGTFSGPPMGNSIGRANFVNGSGVNNGFITGANNSTGVAVDPNFVYWTHSGVPGNFGTTIGRADIHGPGANQSFITGANVPIGVAVDSANVYWTNGGTPGTPGTTIGRANINGTGVNQSFIAGAPLLTGVAVDNNFIYWSNEATNAIGRANKADGSNVNQSFVTGAFRPQLLVVDALLPLGSPPPPPTVADLMASVQGRGLPHGIERSLLDQLGAAQQGGACDNLRAFMDHVRAQSGKKIAADDAADLLDDAAAAGESLGCGVG